MLWSFALPGFGHVYLGHYVRALIFMIWEITVNQMSNLNWAVHHFLRGEWEQSLAVVNFHWLLYYPSVFTFDLFLAYNKARDINYELEQRGIPRPEKISHYPGFFWGLMFGMTCGASWCFLTSPIASGLVAGVICGVGGHAIQWFSKRRDDF